MVGWMCIICGTIALYTKPSPFYTWGPNDDLVVLSITINTPTRYFSIIIYSFANNFVRNFNSNLLRPWIVHNVQDNTKEGIMRKQKINIRTVYFINTVSTVYIWFDFLIYIHLLLAQFDLFIIEAVSDIFIANFITHFWYLSNIDTPNTQNVYMEIPNME